MNKEKILNFELYCLSLTILSGVILKYSMQIFGGNLWTVLIGSANNSIWENMKAFSIAYLFWSFIEYCNLKISIKQFVVSKVAGLYIFIILGIVIFSIIKYSMGSSNFFIDIVLMMTLVCVSQFFSYRIMACNIKFQDWFSISVFSLVLYLTMMISFTVNPPKASIFMDSDTQLYGINTSKL